MLHACFSMLHACFSMLHACLSMLHACFSMLHACLSMFHAVEASRGERENSKLSLRREASSNGTDGKQKNEEQVRGRGGRQKELRVFKRIAMVIEEKLDGEGDEFHVWAERGSSGGP